MPTRTHGLNRRLDALLADEEGATAVEYGVIATGIFLATIVAISLFATNAVAMWTNIAGHM